MHRQIRALSHFEVDSCMAPILMLRMFATISVFNIINPKPFLLILCFNSAVDIARENLRVFGFDRDVQLNVSDISKYCPAVQPALVVTNPP